MQPCQKPRQQSLCIATNRWKSRPPKFDSRWGQAYGRESPERRWPRACGGKFVVPFASCVFERGSPGLGHVEILLFASGADSDGAHDLSIDDEGHSAANRRLLRRASYGKPQGKRHVDLLALRRAGWRATHGGGLSFYEGNGDGRGLRAVHALEEQQVRPVVDDGDVHGAANVVGATLRSGEHGACAFRRKLRMIAGDEWHVFSQLRPKGGSRSNRGLRMTRLAYSGLAKKVNGFGNYSGTHPLFPAISGPRLRR